jgi:hypothetical protein
MRALMALMLHLGGVGNLGIYRPLRHHAQCGENNVQLKDKHMIYAKGKRENLCGKTHGLRCRNEKGWA